MNDATPQDAGTTEVFYDGACPLCSAEIGHYRRRAAPGTLRFTDVSGPAAPLPEGMARAEMLARFHVRTADGRLLSGAAAFSQLWRVTPGWRWLGQLARLPGMIWLMERGYRAFLHMRPVIVRGFAALSERGR